MRILFITSSRLAEAVISCGILEQLRATYPRARVTVACGAGCAGLFSRLPRVERVINVGKGRSRDFHRFRLWTRLVRQFWDVAVDARGSEITRFLLAGQRKVIRIRKAGVPYYRQLGDAMGFSPAPLPVTWTNASDHDEAARRLPDGIAFIGLGPTAASTRKVWPPDRYIETYHAIEKILPGCRPVIFSGASDAERLAATAIQSSLGAILMPASLPLPLLAACMSRLRLFIGNDTGLLHLAAASGTPTLGLFGRSRADEFAPAGLHSAAVAAPGPPGEAPMDRLTVEKVLAAVMPLLRT